MNTLEVRNAAYVKEAETRAAVDSSDSSVITVFSGARLETATINEGGFLYVSEGGRVDSITENGGYVLSDSSASASFVSNVLTGTYSRPFTAHNGTVLSGGTVTASCSAEVFSGGIAESTLIEGTVSVHSGGTAYAPVLSNAGTLTVLSSGSAALAYNPFESSGGIIESQVDAIIDYLNPPVLYGSVNAGSALSSGYVLSNIEMENKTALYVMSVANGGGTAAHISNAEAISSAKLSAMAGATMSDVVLEASSVDANLTGPDLTVDSTVITGSVYNVSACITSNTNINAQVNSTVISCSDGLVQDCVWSDAATSHLLRISAGSGGVISNVSVGSNTRITVLSGGTLTNFTALKGGTWNGLYIQGGYVSGVTNDSTLSGYNQKVDIVLSGGTCTGIEMCNPSGIPSSGVDPRVYTVPNTYLHMIRSLDSASITLSIGSETVLSNLNVSMYGLYLTSGNSTVNAHIIDYGSMHVLSGAVAYHTIMKGGSLCVSSGGSAVNVEGQGWGWVHAYSGGVIDSINVKTVSATANGGLIRHAIAKTGSSSWGPSINIASGGTALDFDLDTCELGLTENGLPIYAQGLIYGNSYTYSTEQAAVTLPSGVWLSLRSTVHKDSVTVSGGYLQLFDSSYVSEVTLLKGTVVPRNSNATVNTCIVHPAGYLSFFDGGGTIHSCIENGGCVYLDSGAAVTFIPNTFSGVTISSKGVTVHSGTTANSTTVVKGSMCVYEGGLANNTTLTSDSYFIVYSGGRANYTNIRHSGRMLISSGGIATYVSAYGTYYSWATVSIFSGGTANHIDVGSGGYVYFSSGGVANNVIVSYGGQLNVPSNCTVSNITVSSAGSLYVGSGGTALNVSRATGAYFTSAPGAYVTYA